MVIYSVCILLVIYTYQFENMPMYWRNTTHLSDEWLVCLHTNKNSQFRLFYKLSNNEALSTTVLQLLYARRQYLIDKLFQDIVTNDIVIDVTAP
jgi:hypothetical protein